MSELVLGVDIGGTKLAVGVVDGAGRVVSSVRAPSEAERGPAHVLGRLVDLCRRALGGTELVGAGVSAAGIGCGGPLDPVAGVVKNPPNLPGWLSVPVVQELSQALGLPAYLDNDANAAALGEHRFGAGRGVRNMVYLTLSTGIGGGVIVGGRLYRGQNGNAGEIGHMSLAFDGRPCKCGSRGCLEAYASGTSIAERARERLAALAPEASVMPRLAGSLGAVTAQTVEQAARAGDAVALELWDETMMILGAGVANVVNVFNPQRVVLGGGLTNAGEMLFAPVRRIALERAMRPLAEAVQIVAAALGAQVGVLGAAAVALSHLESDSSDAAGAVSLDA